MKSKEPEFSQTSTCPVDHHELKSPLGCPVSHRAAEFDPFSEAYQLDPATYLQWARANEPVFYSPRLRYWVVTRYADVKAIFRDNVTFSPSVALEKITPTRPEAEEVLRSYDYGMDRTLVNEDEPAHMERRRALMKPFTPEELVHHEQMVRDLAREAVDSFVDAGQADLVTQMLYTVPLTVGMRFLGIPEEDIGPLKEFAVAHTVNTWGRPDPGEQVAVAHAVGKFWQYSSGVLDKIRLNPSGPGWMQYSVRQQANQPDVVTDSYLHSMMMAGIVAAHETTAHAASNAIKLLLQNPSWWSELCEDSSLIPNAVEECLRYAGSVAAWRRITTRDTEVDGVAIPSGSRLLIVQATANRDPRQFEDGDEFDLHRVDASDHLTFGYGAHQCMGKNLARMELQVFLQELTTRLPHLELADQEFRFVPNTSFRGPEHLLVRWDAAQNPEHRKPEILTRRQPVSMGKPSAAALSRLVIVEDARMLSERVMQLTLRDTRGAPSPRWTSGTHIDVECGTDSYGEPRSRQYSLCGPIDAGTYQISVLLEEESRGGSQWIHANAICGERLRIRGPRNHFRLDQSADRLVLIAGGIGITPILAHADAAKAAGIAYHIHYVGRSAKHLAYLDRLSRDHAEHVTTYFKDEGERLSLPDLVGDLPAGAQVYACGPQRLIDELEELGRNWPDCALHVEHFSSSLVSLDPAKEHAFNLELKTSGLTLKVAADQTVLQTLRGANIDIQSDCEEGLCGSCEAAVLKGVIDHRDVVLNKSEREAGKRMMTCCSRASGDLLVLDL